jgi:hypothetical protein
MFEGFNYVSPAAQQVMSDLSQIEGYTFKTGFTAEQMGTTSLRGFRNLVFGAQMGLFYTSMLAGGMNKTESAEIALEMAQDRLNEAVKRYGPNSDEATRATQQLERSQLYYQRAVTYSQLMTVTMGLQVVSMGMNFASAIPSLLSLSTTLHTVAASFHTLYAAMGPVGWAILGISAAAAIGTGVYMATRPVELPSTLNVNSTSDLDDVLEQYKARLKRAITAAG